MAEMAKIEVLAADGLEEARPLLLDLMVEDQRHYQHDRHDRADIDGGLLGPLRPGFSGENVLLAIRDQGRLVALCWCVIFDPGTGLEGEVAEVYVVPEQRGRGLATRLVRRAVQLFQERRVTFASVWTHSDNPAAVRLYRSAGFAPTEQTVLTWLPGGD
ncbi:MAG TPA: GNAT family N-acetyltransferase [Candidatus Solibacter sp.]|jgi:ribosomal protein S18 acetylase RimI-like enzyme|nr:GNAT family N-acetyltransferase [Candidatus Solibacter sp.]